MLSTVGILWWSLQKLSWSAHGQGSLLEIMVALGVQDKYGGERFGQLTWKVEIED